MFGNSVPFISLGPGWNVVYASNEIKEKYSSLLAPGFFTALLNGYTPEYFAQPVRLSAPGAKLAGIRLIFAVENDAVKCYPVKNETYAGMAQRNVQYQMREPITGIFSLLPLLTDSINKGNGINAISTVEKINRQSYRLLKNVTNITLVSKIMDGSLPGAEPLSLSSLLSQLILSVQAVENNVTVDTDIADNVVVNGNKHLLSCGILNLVSNSIAFASDEKVEISIGLKEDAGRIVFTYSDNSKGIKDEYLPHIFKPYFSKDPFADGESDPSMGLGLTITKAAFEQAGGRIMLTSEFGKGVKYTISIPQKDHRGNVLKSSATDFLLDRYSQLFVQLCDSCILPDLK